MQKKKKNLSNENLIILIKSDCKKEIAEYRIFYCDIVFTIFLPYFSYTRFAFRNNVFLAIIN